MNRDVYKRQTWLLQIVIILIGIALTGLLIGRPRPWVKMAMKFYKIYEPLNPDKQWRFSYTPEGVKPKDYINGLSAVSYTHLNNYPHIETIYSQVSKR